MNIQKLPLQRDKILKKVINFGIFFQYVKKTEKF